MLSSQGLEHAFPGWGRDTGGNEDDNSHTEQGSTAIQLLRLKGFNDSPWNLDFQRVEERHEYAHEEARRLGAERKFVFFEVPNFGVPAPVESSYFVACPMANEGELDTICELIKEKSNGIELGAVDVYTRLETLFIRAAVTYAIPRARALVELEASSPIEDTTEDVGMNRHVGVDITLPPPKISPVLVERLVERLMCPNCSCGCASVFEIHKTDPRSPLKGRRTRKRKLELEKATPTPPNKEDSLAERIITGCSQQA